MSQPVFLKVYHSGKLMTNKQFVLDQISIGSSADGPSLTLADPSVCFWHALIEKRGGGYYISDLGSPTGTFINSKPILESALKHGDQIQIGDFVIQFFIGVPFVKPNNLSDKNPKPVQSGQALDPLPNSGGPTVSAKEVPPPAPQSQPLPKATSQEATSQEEAKKNFPVKEGNQIEEAEENPIPLFSHVPKKKSRDSSSSVVADPKSSPSHHPKQGVVDSSSPSVDSDSRTGFFQKTTSSTAPALQNMATAYEEEPILHPNSVKQNNKPKAEPASQVDPLGQADPASQAEFVSQADPASQAEFVSPNVPEKPIQSKAKPTPQLKPQVKPPTPTIPSASAIPSGAKPTAPVLPSEAPEAKVTPAVSSVSAIPSGAKPTAPVLPKEVPEFKEPAPPAPPAPPVQPTPPVKPVQSVKPTPPVPPAPPAPPAPPVQPTPPVKPVQSVKPTPPVPPAPPAPPVQPTPPAPPVSPTQPTPPAPPVPPVPPVPQPQPQVKPALNQQSLEKTGYAPSPSTSPPPSPTPSKESSLKPLSKGTYAPESEIKDLSSYLSPGNGPVVEVVVAWKERVLSVHHFEDIKKEITFGSDPKADIFCPNLVGTPLYTLLDTKQNPAVFLSKGVKVSVRDHKGQYSFDKLSQQGLITTHGSQQVLPLGQGQLICLTFSSTLEVYVRYANRVQKAVTTGLFNFNFSEMMGLMMSFFFMSMLVFYVALFSPQFLDSKEELEEADIKKATIEFKKKKRIVKLKMTNKAQKKRTKLSIPNKSKKPKKTKKVGIKKPGKQGRLGQVAAKPKSKSKKKTVTSARSGGAVHTKKAGAGPKSPRPDPTKVGLLGVFGKKGTQKVLDKAYSGTGELAGLADQATGYAGQKEAYSGEGIGTKFKNAGAGGKGSALIGVSSGIRTKGRGGGAKGYGRGGSLGQRGMVQLALGTSDWDVAGGVDKNAILRVIRRNKHQLEWCYEFALQKRPDMEGKVLLKWDILNERVRGVSVMNNTTGDSALARCLMSRLKNFRFTGTGLQKGQIGEVRIPFAVTKR